MNYISGKVIDTLTAPGVVVHELAHKFFCDLFNIEVYEVRYFQQGYPSGYVIHGPARKLYQSFLISFGPFIINTLLCMILTMPFALCYTDLQVPSHPVYWLLEWIGLSAGMHAFPSRQDANGFMQDVQRFGGNYKIFLPIVRLLRLGSNLSVYTWFDLMFAIAISMIIPLSL
jgi:hypothetical protein